MIELTKEELRGNFILRGKHIIHIHSCKELSTEDYDRLVKKSRKLQELIEKKNKKHSFFYKLLPWNWFK